MREVIFVNTILKNPIAWNLISW